MTGSINRVVREMTTFKRERLKHNSIDQDEQGNQDRQTEKMTDRQKKRVDKQKDRETKGKMVKTVRLTENPTSN